MRKYRDNVVPEILFPSVLCLYKKSEISRFRKILADWEI